MPKKKEKGRSSLSRGPNQRRMDKVEENTHKYSRTKDSKFSFTSLLKKMKKEAIHFQIDNMTALSYLLKMKQQETMN